MYNHKEQTYKIFYDDKEKKDFMKYYFWHIGDGYFIDALNNFKDKSGFGIECVGILFRDDFDEWEEYRCKEDEVSLIKDYPAAEEDTMGYLSFKDFYNCLIDHSKEYIKKYPEHEEEVCKLLREIKVSLDINT